MARFQLARQFLRAASPAEIDQFMVSMSRNKFVLSYLSKAAKSAVSAACTCSGFIGLAFSPGAAAATSATCNWPESYQSRLEILALMETLNAELLASHSATQTLTDWCAAHHLADQPKIVAHLQKGATKDLSPEQRRDLNIDAKEPVIYRRVDLACGAHVLSQADNWYVPSRLTPAMNAALTSSDTPFGQVIRPLHPQRRTLDVTMFWRPLPAGWEMQPAQKRMAEKSTLPPLLLFQHRAIVSDAEGRPISEVIENYTRESLQFLCVR